MFGPILKGLGLAASPRGRKVIAGTVGFVRSEEGRKVLSHAHKVATSPEARRLAQQAGHAARKVGKAAASSENQERLKAAARALRERRGG